MCRCAGVGFFGMCLFLQVTNLNLWSCLASFGLNAALRMIISATDDHDLCVSCSYLDLYLTSAFPVLLHRMADKNEMFNSSAEEYLLPVKE